MHLSGFLTIVALFASAAQAVAIPADAVAKRKCHWFHDYVRDLAFLFGCGKEEEN